jgi:hypothetical protein
MAAPWTAPLASFWSSPSCGQTEVVAMADPRLVSEKAHL